MKKVALGLLSAALILGCSGNKQADDQDAVNDALVGFTVNSQADRWPEALSYVCEDEVDEISDGQTIKPEYQVAAKRLRLSTLKQMNWEVDRHGRLIGIKAAMDESNKKYTMSKDQSKVGSDLEEKRQQRIQEKIAEGKRIVAGDTAMKTPEVEYYTNKLTEEEKRKYGSTGELRAPEDNTSTQESTKSTDSMDNSSKDNADSSSTEPSDSSPAEAGSTGGDSAWH
ncbi:MAG: hypothetical protein WCS54_05240 [Fibrobacteraceae bacterium]